jgi:hypothetical protein
MELELVQHREKKKEKRKVANGGHEETKGNM